MFFRKRKERKLEAEQRKLEAEQRAQDLTRLQQELDEVTDGEGVVSVEGFQHFFNFVGDQGIDLAPFPDILKDVRLGLAQGGIFLPSEDATLILKKDETPLLDTPVNLLKEVTDREYVGGSQGVSIPLGGRVRYRVGAMRGHMVTIGSHWAVADQAR
jgi:hypothetical protein